mgnify:CR=1 FL=1
MPASLIPSFLIMLDFTKRTPEIRTERLLLRALMPSDLEDMLSILQNDKVKLTYMLPDFPTREDAVKLFDRLLALSHSAGHLVVGVCRGEKLIGFLNSTEIAGDSIEVGYAYHPDHWNHGYATEALKAMIAELFRLGFSVVRAGYFEENPASGRVMEKSGMQHIEYTDSIEYRGKTHRCIYYEICEAV